MISALKQLDKTMSKLGARFWMGVGVIGFFFILGILNHNYLLGWPSDNILISTIDPDVWLRLTKVRELIQTGNLHDHLIRATNAPYAPLETPWTRPVDFILVALYSLTPSSWDINKSLLIVSVWYPILMNALIIFFICKAAEVNFKSALKVGTALVLLAGYVYHSMTLNYFMIGNVDHHSFQVLLWCMAIYFFTGKNTPRNAVYTGLCLGTWFWISPESLPFIAIFWVIMGIQAFFMDAPAKHAILTNLVLTIVSIIALFIEIPLSDIFTKIMYDTLSIIHVVLFTFATLGFLILGKIKSTSLPLTKQMASIAIAGGTIITIFLVIFPKFIKGPMADVDPYILSTFLPNVWEAEEIFEVGSAVAIPTLYLPLIALLLGFQFAKRDWALFTLFIVPFGMIFYQVKWDSYLIAISTIIIAKYLPEYIRAARKKISGCGKYIHPYSLPLILPVFISLISMTELNRNLNHSDDVKSCWNTGLQTIQSGHLVKALSNTSLILESNVNGNVAIPFFTPYRYIASFYHREGKAMEAEHKIWISPNFDSIYPIIKEREVDVLFICPSDDKTSWVNAYFNGKPHPQNAFLTIDKTLTYPEMPAKKEEVVKPLLLRINK